MIVPEQLDEPPLKKQPTCVEQFDESSRLHDGVSVPVHVVGPVVHEQPDWPPHVTCVAKLLQSVGVPEQAVPLQLQPLSARHVVWVTQVLQALGVPVQLCAPAVVVHPTQRLQP